MLKITGDNRRIIITISGVAGDCQTNVNINAKLTTNHVQNFKEVYCTKGAKSDINVKLALNGNTFLKIVNETTGKTLKAEKDCSVK
ncbi:MAG: hypothetical protein LBH37_02560 [Oscillospiraceae bacterium]|jgi:uncharacterized protein (UPF0333 family)|nr:hypothetical protein [Oscillospiraceae bacterium]